ncbi:MAG: class I SAM-dependent methyltransferase [Planctomycetota bacterium]
MNWRESQVSFRRRLTECYDTAGVDRYESWIAKLDADDDRACLEDLRPEFQFVETMRVLDAGAGTGAMCRVILSAADVKLTALEPVPAMISRLRAKPELRGVRAVEGYCDAESDHRHFDAASFDVIVSRQLCNGLYDPLAAFRNWLSWLTPGGTLLAIDGIYDRDAWDGEMKVDTLPLSACRTMATVPYLLEIAGFELVAAKWMTKTNRRPLTRTPRYVVIARKPRASRTESLDWARDRSLALGG